MDLRSISQTIATGIQTFGSKAYNLVSSIDKRIALIGAAVLGVAALIGAVVVYCKCLKGRVQPVPPANDPMLPLKPAPVVVGNGEKIE